MSLGDDRYDEEETEAKLSQAIAATPPRLCSSIEEAGGNCSTCPFRERINSPVALGYVTDPVITELARRWVYIATNDCFIDLLELDDVA